jgi:hypothetical protein
MLEKRPIIIDENKIVLWWNMRLKELWYKDVYVIRADNRSEDQKNQFIIKDNVWFWEWDQDDLLSERDADKLSEWWLDNLNFEEIDFDNIEWNQDRGSNDKKVQNVICPMCNHHFNI